MKENCILMDGNGKCKALIKTYCKTDPECNFYKPDERKAAESVKVKIQESRTLLADI